MSAHTAELMVRPYRPTYAREVEMIPDWIPKAKKYLRDTGTGSLRALFAKLERDGQLDMIAVLNLLGCNIKGQVVKNTKIKADKLELQPEPGRVDEPEYLMALRLAIVAFQAVMMREQAHSKEFGRVKGQHKPDVGVVVSITFEAFLDYREGAHDGYLVNKLFPHLPSNTSNPSPLSPITDVELPFTPEVVLHLADKASRIRMARRYLGDSRLFSEIHLLDLSSPIVQQTVVTLLDSTEGAVCKQIHGLTADATKHLNASNRGKVELAQGKSLNSRLIRLAVDLVGDRKRKFPREFEEDGMIASNLRVLFALAFEAFVAYDDEGSYFHRKLAAASKRTIACKGTTTSKTPTTSQSATTFETATTSKSTENSKSATTFKRAATSKRTIAQTNTDSTRDESSITGHESHPMKKRKKQVSKKHDYNVLEQTQELTGSDAPGARGFVEVDSDPESSLFIPQTASPVDASPDNFFEEFGHAFDKGQTEKYSVFSKGSEGPSTASNVAVSAPQKQRASALPGGGDRSPVRSTGKNGGSCRRKPRK